MKNFLYMNYGLVVKKIYNNKYFFINNEKILLIFTELNEDKINYIAKISDKMITKGIPVSTLLLNNKNNYFTNYKNKKLVLLRENCINDEVQLDDYRLIKFEIEKYNILDEWKKEVDQIEIKSIEYNNEFPEVSNSINYYLGMAENAIILMARYFLESECDYLCHRLLSEENNAFDFYNPFNFISSLYLYDITNYFKIKFYKGKLDYDELLSVINNENINGDIFLSLMMYPNIYFKNIKEIFNEKSDEKKLKNIIIMSNKYEKLLLFCKENIRNLEIGKIIDWFNK